MNRIMRRSKFMIALAVMLLVCGNSYSQQVQSGGSPYSLFGIGDMTFYSSTRAYSMGITGISLMGNYVNNLNPATLGKLNSTLFAINANYGFLKSTNDISENKVSNGNVLGVNIGIPFDQGRGWVMSLGFNPMSIVNYKIRLLGTTGGGQDYTQTYSGKGGLSRINVGMTYNLLRMINVGLEYNYSFGEIREQNFIDFNNSSFTNTDTKRETDFQKSFVKGGLVFEMGRIFRNPMMKSFTIGFVFQSGIDLSATEDGIYSSETGADTIRLNSGIIQIPDAYGFGISNTFNGKYTISGDVIFQDWSKFTAFGSPVPQLENSIRGGLGMEILPTPGKAGFWQIVTYRFGGFYEKGNIKLSGENINSYGLRAGLNIPISQYNSIDFGINYSIRGKTGNGLIKDEFLNFTAGVNFGELWFIRPRDEDQ